MNKKTNQKGVALAAVVLAMMLVLIVIPALYRSVDRDTRWSVENKSSSLSMELAMAGLDRALWKLKETNEHWYTILSTGPLTGYHYDEVFNDVTEDGYYKIDIASSATSNNELVITVQAKDAKSNSFRAVRAYARKSNVAAPLHGYELLQSSGTDGLFTVHWGPIYATGKMTLHNIESNQLYPRKYSAAQVLVFNSTGVYASRDSDPNEPNTDDSEYWAFYDVPPIVTPDFDYYKTIAQANGTYYNSAVTLTAADINHLGPDQVFYCEAKCTFSNADKFGQGILIAETTLEVKGYNSGVSSSYPNNYSTTPPSTAPQEYQKNTPSNYNAAPGSIQGDTLSQDEYPGDGGLATVKSFTFGSTTGGSTGYKPFFKGFIYVGTKLKGNDKRQVLHGAMVLSKNCVVKPGVEWEIFYDDSIEIRTSSRDIYLDDWEEIAATPF